MLVFVTWWKCVWVISNTSCSCFISTISVSLAALSKRCWTDCIGVQLPQRVNLKIKPKKLFFFQSSVLFLGHVLSKDGILPSPEKVSKVRDWPTPKLANEVHSFLALASYYQRFIPQFTKWANPLHDLIHPVATKKKCVCVLKFLPYHQICHHIHGLLIIRNPLTS